MPMLCPWSHENGLFKYTSPNSIFYITSKFGKLPAGIKLMLYKRQTVESIQSNIHFPVCLKNGQSKNCVLACRN